MRSCYYYFSCPQITPVWWRKLICRLTVTMPCQGQSWEQGTLGGQRNGCSLACTLQTFMKSCSVPGAVPATGDTKMNGTHCPLIPAPPCPPLCLPGPVSELCTEGGTRERHGLGARQSEHLGSCLPLTGCLMLDTLWPQFPHCSMRELDKMTPLVLIHSDR